jgi:hypothetical protein
MDSITLNNRTEVVSTKRNQPAIAEKELCIIRTKDKTFIIRKKDYEKKSAGTVLGIKTYIKIDFMDYKYEPSKSLGLF